MILDLTDEEKDVLMRSTASRIESLEQWLDLKERGILVNSERSVSQTKHLLKVVKQINKKLKGE